MQQPPRIRLTVDGEGEPGERVIYVDELLEPTGSRRIGHIYVPAVAVPQLGALGVLVGLGVFTSLELVGDDAPAVLQLEPRMIRLLKIAAKVLG